MNERCPTEKALNFNSALNHYSFCMYAVDVTFQQSNRQSGNTEKGKLHISAKHKLYGIKIELSVLPNDRAILVSTQPPSSVADVEIFSKDVENHRALLIKKGGDCDLGICEHVVVC